MGWQQHARPWFGGVPSEIPLCGEVLTHAQEAIDRAAPPEQRWSVGDDGERPGEDWAAAMVLKLARLQLGEMANIIEMLTGVPADAIPVDDVGSRLEDRARRRFVGEDLALAVGEIDALLEGLLLREALVGDIRVAHGFQVDGSITLTTGPSIPETSIIGLKGSVEGEMEDEPDEILRLAVTLTRSAASLYWRLGGAPEVATPPQENHGHEGTQGSPRKVSGSDDFVAASIIDQERSDLTFEQCLTLARLVLRYEGGPVPTSGKKAKMPIVVARHLNKLGLAERVQAGQVEAVYESKGGNVSVIGSRDRAQWHVMATESGRELVRCALLPSADPVSPRLNAVWRRSRVVADSRAESEQGANRCTSNESR